MDEGLEDRVLDNLRQVSCDHYNLDPLYIFINLDSSCQLQQCQII